MRNGIFPAMRINMNVIVISHCSPPMWGLFTLFMEFSNHIVKAMVFPVVMYRCDSWTIKLSAEELMFLNCGVGEDFWESLEQQGDQILDSILKEISPEYSL